MNKYHRTAQLLQQLTTPLSRTSTTESSSLSHYEDKSIFKRKIKLLRVITEVDEPEDPESDEADKVVASKEDLKHRLERELVLDIARKLNKHLRWHCIA